MVDAVNAQDLADKYEDLFGRITGEAVRISLDAIRLSGLVMATCETKRGRDVLVNLSARFNGLKLEHCADDTTAVFSAA